MAEKLFSYADKQVMEEVGSGGDGGGQDERRCIIVANGPDDTTCNMTFSELSEFLNEGNSNIFLKLNRGNYYEWLPCTRYHVESGLANIQFLEVNTGDNSLRLYYVVFDSDENYVELGITKYRLSVME